MWTINIIFATVPEIRIGNFDNELHEKLTNIAKNKGITLNDFLKPHLREVAQKYALLVNEEIKGKKKEIRLRGVNETIDWQLNNVSNNLSVNLTDILKVEFYLLASKYPEYMKKPPRDF